MLPGESVVRGGLTVSEPYRSYDRKLGLNPYYNSKFGTKYDEGNLYPSSYHIAAVEHDIKHQLAALERNLAAARPYLATNPQILHEAEEQLRTLQHIHADRLLHGIESIRQLEIQQEVLIHKVNAQLENSVQQLKHLAVLQQEISNKQKSQVHSDALPVATIEASRHLTAQLHAIEAAKAQEAAAHEIAKDAMDHAIAKEAVDHAIATGVSHHVHEDDPPRRSGVSSDAGVFVDNGPALDPRTTSGPEQTDSHSRSDDGDQPLIFELGGK